MVRDARKGALLTMRTEIDFTSANPRLGAGFVVLADGVVIPASLEMV
jgi:hypothetical protein